MSKHFFNSISVCHGCGLRGDDFGSVNVEAFEVTGELYCEDCAEEAIVSISEDQRESE